MWEKILNALGFESKEQKAEYERAKLAVLREARQAQAQRRLSEGNRKINGGNDNWKQKSSQQVRAERYGHDDYLTPGFNLYEPTVMIPVIPTLMDSYEAPSHSSSHSDSSHSSGGSFDSGSDSGSYDSGSSYDSSGGGSW